MKSNYIVFLSVVASLAVGHNAHGQLPSPVSAEILAVPQDNSHAQAAVTGFPATSSSFAVEAWVYFPSYPPYRDFMLLQQEGFCEVSVSKGTYPYDSYYELYFGKATGTPGQFAGPGYWKTYYSINDEWHHVAATYDSSTDTKRFFLDGILLSPNFTSTTTYATVPPTDVVVGGTSTGSLGLGYYADELRVSSSVRYTSSFTPPTAPYTPDGTTAALWHFDDGAGSTSFADASTNTNDLIGYNGAVIYGAILGDYDGNGSVGEEDYNVWKANFGTTYAAADGNGNGVVDAADYTVWRDNLAAGSGSLAIGAAVPEPAAWLILATAMVGIWSARRQMT